jgi:hypothetical protein
MRTTGTKDDQQRFRWILICLLLIGLTLPGTQVQAESSTGDDSPYATEPSAPPNDDAPPPSPMNAPATAPSQTPSKPARQKRKYFIPDTQRSDAGVFHVAFAVGGNFYIEPVVNATTGIATGDFYKDFGFQGGVFFDYDYSQMTENIPIALRGMIGYKYVLSSVNVFTFDGVVRYMVKVSDKSSFGIGPGVSAGVWYRTITATSAQEQVVFLPSLLLNAGFDFNPFMTNFNWVVTRIGSNSTIMGWELYFGFRL